MAYQSHSRVDLDRKPSRPSYVPRLDLGLVPLKARLEYMDELDC